MDFKNKVVLITGASSGIGAAAAELFAKQSARVVLIGRNVDNLKQTAVKCSVANAETLVIPADLNITSEVKDIVQKVIEKFGRIDVLVNNAGVGVQSGIKDGVEPFDRAMAVNVRAVYLLTSLVVPYLIKVKGNIVNVSSVAAFKPIKDANYLPYCISKAALDQFTKCVALELAKDGVRVNSVNPGGTRTPFALNAGFSQMEVNELYSKRNSVYPLGKMAESEDVANVIIFLASDRASSVTGSIYVVDNGESLQ